MAGVEGFLPLDEAALQLQLSVSELSRHIEEGRVVAIVRDSGSWLSMREVSRLKRQLQRGVDKAIAPSTILVEAPNFTRQSALLSQEEPSLDDEKLRLSKADKPPAEDLALIHELEKLNSRLAEAENRKRELEVTNARLQLGIQETEATLKRNRATRVNLEDEVLALQEHLGKVRARSEALEREVQHLSSELERKEETYSSELRKLRSKGEAQSTVQPTVELESVRSNMAEKDRLLAQQYQEMASLRSYSDDMQQKFFELKARYEKEKSEWSETVARAYQSHNQMREQIEELKIRTSQTKGWNPFRREK